MDVAYTNIWPTRVLNKIIEPVSQYFNLYFKLLIKHLDLVSILQIKNLYSHSNNDNNSYITYQVPEF